MHLIRGYKYYNRMFSMLTDGLSIYRTLLGKSFLASLRHDVKFFFVYISNCCPFLKLELLVKTHKKVLQQKSSKKFHIFSTGYSASALLAIIFAIPFGRRLLTQEDQGRWNHLGEAFYTAHFELFLGNACLGEII